MRKINKKNINLYDTITCGQIFRFEVINDEYIIILSDRVVKLKEDDNYIYITSSNYENIENILEDYLGLSIDYENINNELIKRDETLKEIINKCTGFKIINSPKLETIISYMISASNNVRNIQRCVNLLSEKYGEKVEFEENTYYLFPTLDVLKKLTIEDLNNAKLGFRSNYIYNLVNNITMDDINRIEKMSTDEATEYLCSYKGIGLKIASCILLFGYERLDVFPIDTWVKKYMQDTYGISDIKKIKEFTKEKYKDYSGLVIQYMFHSKRNKIK